MAVKHGQMCTAVRYPTFCEKGIKKICLNLVCEGVLA